MHNRNTQPYVRTTVQNVPAAISIDVTQGYWSGGLKNSSYNQMRRKRSALVMTETELKLIAALAIMGLSSHPKMG